MLQENITKLWDTETETTQSESVQIQVKREHQTIASAYQINV